MPSQWKSVIQCAKKTGTPNKVHRHFSVERTVWQNQFGKNFTVINDGDKVVPLWKDSFIIDGETGFSNEAAAKDYHPDASGFVTLIELEYKAITDVDKHYAKSGMNWHLLRSDTGCPTPTKIGWFISFRAIHLPKSPPEQQSISKDSETSLTRQELNTSLRYPRLTS